ncbi:hypothetical protein [Actinoplanes sp. ATCC 53533]|uniref:hypothetical protein n=1 Tax=Actinoplanes sp. ATCC 53533 TaxID=1288362 RepID=UPI000F77C488|nr:hypothetical protein [Actinoplanes sp. ATCC 53533]
MAVRGLIAVAVLGAAHRAGTDPDEVPLSVVLAGLLSIERLTALAKHATGDSPASVARHDGSAAEMWAWLNRRWSTDAEGRWDGLPRGIARGLPDPAIDVCLQWAASAVAKQVEEDRDALQRRQRVVITAGPHTDRPGTIESAAWRVTGTEDDLLPGPPEAYLVTIITPEGKAVHEVITAADFTVTSAANR